MNTIISAYAPTLKVAILVKEQFYTELNKPLNSIPKLDKKNFMGDFNARVGRNYAIWPEILDRNEVFFF